MKSLSSDFSGNFATTFSKSQVSSPMVSTPTWFLPHHGEEHVQPLLPMGCFPLSGAYSEPGTAASDGLHCLVLFWKRGDAIINPDYNCDPCWCYTVLLFWSLCKHDPGWLKGGWNWNHLGCKFVLRFFCGATCLRGDKFLISWGASQELRQMHVCCTACSVTALPHFSFFLSFFSQAYHLFVCLLFKMIILY